MYLVFLHVLIRDEATMKIKFYLSILIVIYIILGFATAAFAYQKAEGQFVLAEEEVEDIEKAIERCETLPKVCQDLDGKEIPKDDDRYVNECNDYKYCGKQIELDGEKKYLSHTTGDTLNAMGTFIFLFIMSAVYLFTSIFLGYAGGFFRSKQ